jgi:uncharacterized membrane protein (DUF2068 family)
MNRGQTGIVLIGAFKLLKGLLLVVTGVGALKLLHADIPETLNHWVEFLRVDPDNRFIHKILSKALSVTPKQLAELSAGTFFYAVLLLTEGVGLLLQKVWAEYFTVITTAAFIPLELYELVKRITIIRILVLLINIAIVAYLAARVRSRKQPQLVRV